MIYDHFFRSLLLLLIGKFLLLIIWLYFVMNPNRRWQLAIITLCHLNPLAFAIRIQLLPISSRRLVVNHLLIHLVIVRVPVILFISKPFIHNKLQTYQSQHFHNTLQTFPKPIVFIPLIKPLKHPPRDKHSQKHRWRIPYYTICVWQIYDEIHQAILC